MMIWKLTRKDIDIEKRYTDEVKGVIIRADSARGARHLANTVHGDEGLIWTNPDRVDCEPIAPDGFPPLVLLVDYVE